MKIPTTTLFLLCLLALAAAIASQVFLREPAAPPARAAAGSRPAPHPDALAIAKSLHGHSAGIRDVAFSPDGKILASASLDNSIKLWNLPEGSLLRTLEAHTDGVLSVNFSPDGKYLLSGSYDRRAILWNVSTGDIEQIWDFPFYTQNLQFLPDSRRFVALCNDTISLFDIHRDHPLLSFDAPSFLLCMALSPSGRLVTGDNQGTLVLWDLNTGLPVRHHSRPHLTPSGHDNAILFTSFPSENLVRFSDEQCIWQWNLATDQFSIEWPFPAQASEPLPNHELYFEAALNWICARAPDLSFHETRQGPTHFSRLAVSPAGDFIAVARGVTPEASKWISEGPQDVELYSIPAILRAARQAQAAPTPAQSRRAAAERAQTQPATRAADPRDWQ